jgi:hypothetical protein
VRSFCCGGSNGESREAAAFIARLLGLSSGDVSPQEEAHSEESRQMVENPNPPTPTAQEFSKFSAESAPFVYFDGVITAGVHQTVIQLELAATTLVPTPDGKTTAVHVITGHMRCSPAAAVGLRKAIDSALGLLAPAKGESSQFMRASKGKPTSANKSSVAKRSIVFNGHKTSVSLEDEFWNALKEIAAEGAVHLSDLLEVRE